MTDRQISFSGATVKGRGASKPALTASDLRAAMTHKWCAPEWAIMWEVGDGTGIQKTRSADAVMMSLWPSRGLELHGVEIKVRRGDWRREAQDPTKAEAIARYCDRWWIHTPKGVVQDTSELPPLWGLREYDGRAWRTVREAQKREPEPVTRAFLAAMLRRADGLLERLVQEANAAGRAQLDRERERIHERAQERIRREVELKTKRLERAAENVRAFEAAFGDGAAARYDDFKRLGAAARKVADLNDHGALARRLRAAADEIEALIDLDAQEPDA